MGQCYRNTNSYCPTLTSLLLFLQFAFNEILNLVHFLLLLIQEGHDDTHGGLLQTDTFNLVLQSVLHIAQPQRGMDQDYCKGRNKREFFLI